LKQLVREFDELSIAQRNLLDEPAVKATPGHAAGESLRPARVMFGEQLLGSAFVGHGRPLQGWLIEHALKVDELAQRVAATSEPASVMEAWRIVLRAFQDGPQEARRMRHRQSFLSQHPDLQLHPNENS